MWKSRRELPWKTKGFKTKMKNELVRGPVHMLSPATLLSVRIFNDGGKIIWITLIVRGTENGTETMTCLILRIFMGIYSSVRLCLDNPVLQFRCPFPKFCPGNEILKQVAPPLNGRLCFLTFFYPVAVSTTVVYVFVRLCRGVLATRPVLRQENTMRIFLPVIIDRGFAISALWFFTETKTIAMAWHPPGPLVSNALYPNRASKLQQTTGLFFTSSLPFCHTLPLAHRRSTTSAVDAPLRDFNWE